MNWDACGARELTLDTGHAGPIAVRAAMFGEEFQTAAPLKGEGARRTFAAKAGGHYTFTRTAACAAK